jgi:hypothetical protein
MRALVSMVVCLLASPLVAEEDCARLPKPSVQVKRLDAPLTFNTQYSYLALNNLGAALARPGHQVLGLTRGSASVGFNTSFPSLADKSGRWECVSPQIVMTYGFNPLTVYIAKEFPEGGCAYKEIYTHEMRHVKTYQEHLARIEKELNETLRQRFETGEPWRGPAGQTVAQLRQELDQRWLPFVQRLIKQVEEAQALIDTPEEYERVANTCAGEIKKIRRP